MYQSRIDFRGMKFHSHQTRQTIHFPCWKISLSRYVNIILAGCYWRGKHLIWTPQNHLLEFKKMGNKWCTTLSYILHIILQPKRLPVIHNNHSISAIWAPLDWTGQAWTESESIRYLVVRFDSVFLGSGKTELLIVLSRNFRVKN